MGQGEATHDPGPALRGRPTMASTRKPLRQQPLPKKSRGHLVLSASTTCWRRVHRLARSGQAVKQLRAFKESGRLGALVKGDRRTRQTPPTGTVPTIPGATYQGCFVDDTTANSRALPLGSGNGATNEACIAACSDKGFPIAGKERTEYGGECYCGANLNGIAKASESECNKDCEANTAEICGGSKRLTVFKNDTIDTFVPKVPIIACTTYYGCWVDTVNPRTFPVFQNSNSTDYDCVARCQAKGFTFAGTENFLSAFAQTRRPTPPKSTIASAGFLVRVTVMRIMTRRTQVCGGRALMTVYEATGCIPPTNTITPTVTPTDTPTVSTPTTDIPPVSTPTSASSDIPPTSTQVPPTSTASSDVPPTSTASSEVPPSTGTSELPPTSDSKLRRSSHIDRNLRGSTNIDCKLLFASTASSPATSEVPPTSTASSIPPTSTGTSVPPTSTQSSVAPPTSTASTASSTPTSVAPPTSTGSSPVPPTSTVPTTTSGCAINVDLTKFGILFQKRIVIFALVVALPYDDKLFESYNLDCFLVLLPQIHGNDFDLPAQRPLRRRHQRRPLLATRQPHRAKPQAQRRHRNRRALQLLAPQPRLRLSSIKPPQQLPPPKPRQRPHRNPLPLPLTAAQQSGMGTATRELKSIYPSFDYLTFLNNYSAYNVSNTDAFFSAIKASGIPNISKAHSDDICKTFTGFDQDADIKGSLIDLLALLKNCDHVALNQWFYTYIKDILAQQFDFSEWLVEYAVWKDVKFWRAFTWYEQLVLWAKGISC
ncbi:hypothetical protein DFJ73DRAFT_767624 [Zopfochytrium polystomum]|nr:hypothetical protein DFJ73DRAFT_767624 [Zopfochytrium polystomum]